MLCVGGCVCSDYNKGVGVFSSKFAFTHDTAVVSSMQKKNKNVILMSTLHKSAEISAQEDRKPALILDYKPNKGGVDNLNKVTGTYSCKRRTAWIIDISSYNAFVIWSELNPTWRASKRNLRRFFLEDLGKALVIPYVPEKKMQPLLNKKTGLQNRDNLLPHMQSFLLLHWMMHWMYWLVCNKRFCVLNVKTFLWLFSEGTERFVRDRDTSPRQRLLQQWASFMLLVIIIWITADGLCDTGFYIQVSYSVVIVLSGIWIQSEWSSHIFLESLWVSLGCPVLLLLTKSRLVELETFSILWM